MTVDELYGDVLDALASATVPAYQVAIPSYMRPDECAYRTLATLDRLHVDHDRVTVFVADDHQADAYTEAVGDDWRIVVAKPGLAACRQWYSDEHYPPGTRILNMDDDVLDILARDPDTTKLAPWTGTVDLLATMGWTIADVTRVQLWGISAVENGFYMADEAVIGLRYICGIVHGTRAGDQLNHSELSSGADFVRSIRQFRAHGVLQLRWLTPHTVYFAPGGMQAELGGEAERAADHASRLRVIARTYPKDARLVTKATGPNLRLRAVTHLRIPRATIEGTLNP